MKKILTNLILLCLSLISWAQNTPISVGGDISKFYPVVFKDNNWNVNKPTTLEIGRSSIHADEVWRGALMASFVFHTTSWGNGAEFIEANIRYSVRNFVAGWTDASHSNNNKQLVIWLRGGNTTYFLNSNALLDYTIHDGIQAALPFQQENGEIHQYKTAVDSYVNLSGTSFPNLVYLNSEGTNFINGNVGIGTKELAGARLAVNGNIRAREIKVETTNWPDYVFASSYDLQSLAETAKFIKKNGHLPNIPTAQEVSNGGVNIGEMSAKLLKKIEELTLHLIEKDKQIVDLQDTMMSIQKKLQHLIDAEIKSK